MRTTAAATIGGPAFERNAADYLSVIRAKNRRLTDCAATGGDQAHNRLSDAELDAEHHHIEQRIIAAQDATDTTAQDALRLALSTWADAITAADTLKHPPARIRAELEASRAAAYVATLMRYPRAVALLSVLDGVESTIGAEPGNTSLEMLSVRAQRELIAPPKGISVAPHEHTGHSSRTAAPHWYATFVLALPPYIGLLWCGSENAEMLRHLAFEIDRARADLAWAATGPQRPRVVSV